MIWEDLQLTDIVMNSYNIPTIHAVHRGISEKMATRSRRLIRLHKTDTSRFPFFDSLLVWLLDKKYHQTTIIVFFFFAFSIYSERKLILFTHKWFLSLLFDEKRGFFSQLLYASEANKIKWNIWWFGCTTFSPLQSTWLRRFT